MALQQAGAGPVDRASGAGAGDEALLSQNHYMVKIRLRSTKSIVLDFFLGFQFVSGKS